MFQSTFLASSTRLPILQGSNSRRRAQIFRRSSTGPGTTKPMPVPSIVDVEWLKHRLGEVKVLDASWYMPAQARDGMSEFKTKRIPGARYFSIEEVAEPNSPLPHMLPSEQAFAAAMDALDISNEDHVVVYDGLGIFSSPRAWISVLEGGLPAWESGSGPISTEEVPDEQVHAPGKAARNPPEDTRYRAKFDPSKDVYSLPEGYALQQIKISVSGAQEAGQAHDAETHVRSSSEMLANVGSKGETVIDARSLGRFIGTEPEPRPGLRPGHIPGSHNIPFPQVLKDGRQLKSPEELYQTFQKAGVDVDSRPIVGSCGSGLTVAILALAIHRLNGKVIPIYDGSWSEWGALPDVPVSTEAPPM